MEHVYYKSVKKPVEKIKKARKTKIKSLFEKTCRNQDVVDALNKQGPFRIRKFPPLTTLWAFINQALSEDHSCRNATATVAASTCAVGGTAVSANNSGYCQARLRLALDFVKAIAQATIDKLLDEEKSFLWLGHRLFGVDGTTVLVPDSKTNSTHFKRFSHRPGLPLCRIVGVFSLSTGALCQWAMGPYKGKGTGEVSLFRGILHWFKKNDVVIMDRLFGGYVDMCLLSMRQVHFIVRVPGATKIKNQVSTRLGKNDYLVKISQPWPRPGSIAYDLLKCLPKVIEVRRVDFVTQVKGFRAKHIYVYTSLMDIKKYPPREIAQAYARRWDLEVDFRSLKTHMGMERLRCQTPGMIEKELWVHFLAYNLLRTIMLESALRRNLQPREVSFKEVLQFFSNFRQQLSTNQDTWSTKYECLLQCLTTKVRQRPNRIEPRLLRTNSQKYPKMTGTRALSRFGFWKQGASKARREKSLAS
jgi:hypothetical protein